MLSITIDGYLVEDKLEQALQQIVGSAWLGRELRVPGSRQRWDMAYKLNGHITVVEFDGDAHYRDPLKIKADRAKDSRADALGYHTVRIPYWVQLTTQTLAFYFGLQADVRQSFPHGFIATRLFPASFCESGIARFRTELGALPSDVRNAVVASLRDRVNDHGREYVIPTSLDDIVPAAPMA